MYQIRFKNNNIGGCFLEKWQHFLRAMGGGRGKVFTDVKVSCLPKQNLKRRACGLDMFYHDFFRFSVILEVTRA